MEFTKEQLIKRAKMRLAMVAGFPESQLAQMDKDLAKIALAVLNAPEYIPPHVEEAMGEMCDGGFNAQGIWDLCRESILHPAPCPRCGTVSERPDGLHYCHAGNENDK